MNALKLMRDAEKACVTDDGRALLAKWAHPGVSPAAFTPTRAMIAVAREIVAQAARRAER